MTALLERVMNAAMSLPEIEQNVIAKRWLHELESESQWDHQFSMTEDELAKLAKAALRDERNGETAPINMAEF